MPGISSRTENIAHKITVTIMNNLPNSFPENSSVVAHNRKYYNLKKENTHIQLNIIKKKRKYSYPAYIFPIPTKFFLVKCCFALCCFESA